MSRQSVSEMLIQSSVQGHIQLDGMGKRHGVLYQRFQIHSSLEVLVFGYIRCWVFFVCSFGLVKVLFVWLVHLFFWVQLNSGEQNTLDYGWGTLSYNGWGNSCNTNSWCQGKVSYLCSWRSQAVQVIHKALLLCISKNVLKWNTIS